jgi:alkaline phosphatase
METTEAKGAYDVEKTWSNFDFVKRGATDSAAAATAMSTGVKTYNAAIGVDLDKKPARHMTQAFEEKGKSTGVVTSVQISHATPAGFVAHNDHRNNYSEIAREMILNSSVDVVMGCGHPWFDNSGRQIATPKNFEFVGGEDLWTSLTQGLPVGADSNGDGKPNPWTLVQSRAEFQALMNGDTPARVLGVARAQKTLQQSRSGDAKADPYVVPLIETVPTLEEISRAALNVLGKNKSGFFLMIEGGAVDWSGHANESGRLIEERVDFAKSVEAVVAWIEMNSNWDETLLVVTGDHETGYLTGPGSGVQADGSSVWNPIVNNGKGVLPGMQWNSGGHTNSLIPFFAKGRGAETFLEYAKENPVDPKRGHYVKNTDISRLVFSTIDK